MIEQFEQAWRREEFTLVGDMLRRAGELSAEDQLALFRLDQRERWFRGHQVIVEAYLALQTGLADDEELLLDFLYGEVLLREDNGQQPQAAEYLQRFPQLAGPLKRQFQLHGGLAP